MIYLKSKETHLFPSKVKDELLLVGNGKVSFESCNHQNTYILYDDGDGYVKSLATNGDYDKEVYASWKIEREPQSGQYS